jgi:transposase-like protein
MKPEQDILWSFKALSIREQETLLQSLIQIHELRTPVIESAKESVHLIESRKPCPHCHSTNIYKRGIQNDLRMYSCKDCKRWYNQATGTPLWDIKSKQKWSHYLQCMVDGYSIRKSAKTVGICIQTSFDWRHKILASLNSLVPETLSGILECDELELSINNKGDRNLKRKARKRSTDFSRNNGTNTVVQVVSAQERKGSKIFKVVETKRLTQEHISQALGGKIAKGATMITDKHPSYKAFGIENSDI